MTPGGDDPFVLLAEMMKMHADYGRLRLDVIELQLRLLGRHLGVDLPVPDRLTKKEGER
jgi:hypothetical protein